MRGSILALLEELPEDTHERISLSDDPSANYVIRINTCSDTLMGDSALDFLGKYSQTLKASLIGRAYAKRDGQNLDLPYVIQRQLDTTRFRHAIIHAPPMADVDHFGPSYDPMDWTPPYQVYNTMSVTEAGGEHDPGLSFTPKSLDPFVWRQSYLDARGRYGTHWQ